MADTLSINVVDRSVAVDNHINIAVINQPNPVSGFTASAEQIFDLINIPKYDITDGSGKPVTGDTFYEFFPDLDPHSGGGGGGGGTTILSGDTDPSSSEGDDGDVYLKTTNDLIADSFLKVDDAWQPLVGSDIADVNTGSGGGGGTPDYNQLTGKPKINSITLQNNVTSDDLGIQNCLYDDQTDEVYTVIDGARVVLASNVKSTELIPVMTDINLPYGLIENGNSYGGPGTIENVSPVVAFDGNLSTNVGYDNEDVDNGWISYTFPHQCYVNKISAWFGNWRRSNDITATLFVYDNNGAETELDTVHVTNIGDYRGVYEKFDFVVNATVKKLKFVFGAKVDGTNVYTHEIQAYGYVLP